MIGLLIFFISPIVISLRIMYLMKFKRRKPCAKKNYRTLIVIGSGGHTLEIIKQVKTIKPYLYNPRLYVLSNTDTSSEHKIKDLEEAEFKSVLKINYDIVKIPRSRTVNQSYFTSVFSTLYSIFHSIPVVFNFKPDLILCNGPGTCIPICVIGFLLNALLFSNMKIIFIESICRVKTLSLSGKILLHFADVVIVQWENLQKIYPQTVFLGRLV